MDWGRPCWPRSHLAGVVAVLLAGFPQSAMADEIQMLA